MFSYSIKLNTVYNPLNGNEKHIWRFSFSGQKDAKKRGAHVFIVNVLLDSKKNEQSWGAVYVLQIFLQLCDIGITLPSQSANILYIQKHSHRRKKDKQI